MSHYPQYQQPSVMPPVPGHYGGPQSYSGYGYAPQVASPQSAGGQSVQQQGIQLPGRTTVINHDRTHPANIYIQAMMPESRSQHPYVPANPAPAQTYQAQPPQIPFDTTGQIAPPGMKPRVTATLWEDEGSLCFQVEAKGVCVARREGTVLVDTID